MEQKTTPILAFIAGVLVGKNWPKIEKFLKPYLKSLGAGSTEIYSSLATFLAQQKEKIEDTIAESKISKRKKGVAEEVVTTKKALRKRKPKKKEKKITAKEEISKKTKVGTLENLPMAEKPKEKKTP